MTSAATSDTSVTVSANNSESEIQPTATASNISQDAGTYSSVPRILCFKSNLF